MSKGRLVEEIVEKMHGSANVRVQRRVYLKPEGGQKAGDRRADYEQCRWAPGPYSHRV